MRTTVPGFVLLLALTSVGTMAGSTVGQDEPAGWRHVMLVEDSSGRVVKTMAVLSARPRSFLRLDGVQVPGFSPDDGVRIAESLRAAGLTDEWILARHLLGVTAPENRVRGAVADQEAGPAGRGACPLTIIVSESDGTETRVRVELSGGYVPFVLDTTDPERLVRVRRFSVEDALRIKRAMNAHGFEDPEIMRAWLGLVEGDSAGQDLAGADRGAGAGRVVWAQLHEFKPLDPECNQCLPGTSCPGDCCAGAPQQCESCRVCP